MPDELKNALSEFVRFAQTLRGDEKSEAQAFLDHLFRALGHAGVIEAGATFEFRVAKKPGSPQLELIKGNGAPRTRTKGGKKFADLLWPDRVLIEMKSRGENLEKHYDQTFDYWTHIVPKRPPFVILCNFDEFWIYGFNTQLFDPVERVKLAELPDSISAFNFLLPIWKKPIFGNNWVEVTRRAADQMATVFKEIVARGEDRGRAQQFILQLLVAILRCRRVRKFFRRARTQQANGCSNRIFLAATRQKMVSRYRLVPLRSFGVEAAGFNARFERSHSERQ